MRDAFWHQFDAAVRAAGNPSAAEISRLSGETIDHCVAESTIRGWLAHKRLPRDDEDFLAVIKVLQAERKHDWLPLLHAAQKGRVIPDGDAPDPQPPPSRTRRMHLALAGIGAIAIVAVFALRAPSTSTRSDNPSPRLPERICAEITSPVAQVFPKPGANPYDKIAKYKGDQIVLYPDVADASGPDGRLYRAVRSPARAKPGTSPYSWMLADDITNAPCSLGGGG